MRIGFSMTIGACVRRITGAFGVTTGVWTISGVNFGVGPGVGVLTSGTRTIGDVSVGVGVGVLISGVRMTGPVSVGSGVGAGVRVGSGVNFGGNVSVGVGVGVKVGRGVNFGGNVSVGVGVGVGVLKIGGAKVGVGAGACVGMQAGPPSRDGMKPGGQGVGPTGGWNTPQISLPLIHCGRSSRGQDGGGGGRQAHWPPRQFGCPLGQGIGGGGLPPQT